MAAFAAFAAPGSASGSCDAARCRASRGEEKRPSGGRAHLGGPGADRLRFFVGGAHAAPPTRLAPSIAVLLKAGSLQSLGNVGGARRDWAPRGSADADRAIAGPSPSPLAAGWPVGEAFAWAVALGTQVEDDAGAVTGVGGGSLWGRGGGLCGPLAWLGSLLPSTAVLLRRPAW